MKRVAVVGDSLTSRGLAEAGGWCGLVATAFAGRADVVARGFSGYSSRWLLAALGSLLGEDLGPVRKEGELVVVWAGANDAVLNTTGKRQFVPVDEYCENLRIIVKTFQERGADVVVMNPPPIDEAMRLEHQRQKYGAKATGQLERTYANTRVYAEACRATFAEDASVVFVDIFSALDAKQDPRGLLIDGLHLSSQGQRVVYEVFMQALRDHLPRWSPKALQGPFLSHEKVPTHPARLRAQEKRPGSEQGEKDVDDGSKGKSGGGSLAAAASALSRYLPSASPLFRAQSEPVRILRNARFWSWELNDFAPRGQELVLRGNKIVALRADSSDDAGDDENSIIHDLGGGFVLPGLADAHIHVYQLGETKRNLDLLGCASIDELKQRLAAFVKKNPDREWVVGTGWDHERMGRLPTRQDLDDVVPEGTKVVLWRVCLHILVANTAALEASHISITNPAPVPGGEIDTDPSTGAATGILRENAVKAVVAHVVEKNPAVIAKSITQGLQECLRFGLTGVQTNDEGTLDVYRALDRDGKLPIRVQLTPQHGEVNGPWSSSSGMLAIDRVKLFADGALGANTAALRNLDAGSQQTRTEGATAKEGTDSSTKKNADDSYRGILVHDQAELDRMVAEAHAQNLRVEAHAIGDYAAECMLRAFRSAGLTFRDRPVLTHCQILGADLVAQMASGGVIANVQPTFVPTDASWINERVDGEQLKYSYAWKTLLNAGVQVSGSSDAPVECCAPLLGMYDAIYRPSSHDRAQADSFHENESLSFAQALHLYTLGANFAARRERTRGRIEVGFAADLTVVSENIAADPKCLLSAQVTQVFVAGEPRLDAAAVPGPAVNTVLHRSGPYMEGKNGRFRDHLTCGCHHHHGKIPY
ncbi:Isoamyl acetate-hydrolyzing esterase [Hondaea fermentalgiana]|uniref:Isoamyl acetate-hydrolyzing esterase n=1 Tax=Hondaea fermentalgiana TaxID=2315210 RepID=A0A2R5GP07_9STRA|nr:Isoamyl acetate-hydrolyzing esterase [Hondaea fermentalgiana]|eukprot:GBG32612.1 Isoamyl acetate-hydrolyzing esterase [Hondaea fermentalgiana]